ncbi:hypothetical protein [Ferruginibacter profundus]
MKSLLLITFLFFTGLCFAQTQQNCDAVYDLTIAYKPATIQLLTDTNSFPATNINNIGRKTYGYIQPGHYKILISGQGQTSIVKDSIWVEQGQKLVLNFKINGPCLYDHPSGYIPTCPKNHTDNIIPIVYGLIATRGDTFIKDKKEMKIKYAGCVVTECDPQFYCKEHDIDF